jgi:hypothetical protein
MRNAKSRRTLAGQLPCDSRVYRLGGSWARPLVPLMGVRLWGESTLVDLELCDPEVAVQQTAALGPLGSDRRNSRSKFH